MRAILRTVGRLVGEVKQARPKITEVAAIILVILPKVRTATLRFFV